MAFTTSDGVELFWDEKGAGTPVLLVMGATYSSAMWYPVIDDLAQHHRVIWFDNRGIGKSSRKRTGSIQDMAADAVAVLDAAGVDKAHVYGVSLGGVVVLQLGLQAPERVLSLVVGCSGILDDAKPRAPKSATTLLAHLPWKLIVSMGKNGYGYAASPEAVAKDLAVLRASRPSSAGLKQQQDALRAYSVTRDAIAALPMPVLVLHGEADRTVPVAWGRELAETLGARLVTYPGSGHNYLVSYGPEANKEVLDFLAGVDG